jgi:hypothetical protein
MRWIRGPINAVLAATLVKPMARWMIARWRRRARDYAEETIILPAQELLGSALPLRLALLDPGLPPAKGRGILHTVLIVGVVAAIAAAGIWALVSLRRRRSATVSQPQAAGDPVALAIEVPLHDPEEAASPDRDPLPSAT